MLMYVNRYIQLNQSLLNISAHQKVLHLPKKFNSRVSAILTLKGN